jgi:nitrite reductase/ring-hydroxylating ferredoxin subunit
LGEDLMAYRDTAGQAGVLGEHYPHQGSSMIFARHEAGGLGCAYHSWLFERGGRCIELPSEGPASSFKAKVRIQAYVTAERQGIGWLYMGPRQNNPPPLPSIELNLDGPTLVKGTPCKYVRQCHWAQALEGDMGAIYDRTQEYLGTTDKVIIAFRRSMLQAAKKFRDTGELPPTVDDASIYRLRGTEVNLPKDANWYEATAPYRVAFAPDLPEEMWPDTRRRRAAQRRPAGTAVGD